MQITDFASGPDGAVGCPESVRWSPTTDTILIRMLGKPMFVAENLYTIEADGTNLTALANSEPNLDRRGRAYTPWWEARTPATGGPNGAYIGLMMGNGEGCDLCVMNADGSGLTEVTTRPGVAASRDAPLGLGLTTDGAAVRGGSRRCRYAWGYGSRS